MLLATALMYGTAATASEMDEPETEDVYNPGVILRNNFLYADTRAASLESVKWQLRRPGEPVTMQSSLEGTSPVLTRFDGTFKWAARTGTAAAATPEVHPVRPPGVWELHIIADEQEEEQEEHVVPAPQSLARPETQRRKTLIATRLSAGQATPPRSPAGLAAAAPTQQVVGRIADIRFGTVTQDDLADAIAIAQDKSTAVATAAHPTDEVAATTAAQATSSRGGAGGLHTCPRGCPLVGRIVGAASKYTCNLCHDEEIPPGATIFSCSDEDCAHEAARRHFYDLCAKCANHGRKVFVGGMDRKVHNKPREAAAELREMVRRAGVPAPRTENISIMVDQRTKLHRGFGYINVRDASEADRIIAALNGKHATDTADDVTVLGKGPLKAELKAEPTASDVGSVEVEAQSAAANSQTRSAMRSVKRSLVDIMHLDGR